MTTYLSPQTGARVVRLMIIGMLLFLVLVVYVFWTGYEGRKDLVAGQRAGCERGKLDRGDNAKGWRTAEAARLASVAEDMHISVDAAKSVITQPPLAGDLPDLIAARNYNEIATSLEDRSRIECSEVFPDANFFP